MKNKITKSILSVATFAVMFGISSCTNLDETVYTDLYKDNFYKNKQEVMQAALRPFTHMQAWMAPTGQNGYWYHAELSSDQLAWPQKGRHGYDGGDHFRQHYHTWDTRENRGRDCWNLLWGGLGYVNSALEDLAQLDGSSIGISDAEMTAIVSELYVLRAFHYMRATELWGGVPIVETVGTPTNPSANTRQEVFDYCKEQLELNVPKLLPYSDELIGRISQTAGYAMLAELYLNAEYLVGTPMYDECIAVCDKIINGEAGGLAGGKPELVQDLLASFSNTNQHAADALFQFAYSRKGGFGFGWDGFLNGYDAIRDAYNWTNGGWNAMVVIPTAFDSYADNDLRKKEWFMFGPQYYLYDSPGKWSAGDPVLGSEEWNGKPIIYVNYIARASELNPKPEQSPIAKPAGIRSTMADGEENSGARFYKYRSGPQTDANYWENHYMLYRLTEIYFNKAEALMRKNGGVATQEAVDLINACRERCFTTEDWPAAQYTVATLTMDELLAERGREFIFEGKRRLDLLRFGKFVTASWWDHEPSNDKNREIYPIPQSQIDANPNLVQNPGYN